jgi:hypothetical protein
MTNSQSPSDLLYCVLLDVWGDLGYFCGVFYVYQSRLTFKAAAGIN